MQTEQSFWKSLLHSQKRLGDIQDNIQGLHSERAQLEKTIHEQERILLYKILAENETDYPVEAFGVDQSARNKYLLERLPIIIDKLKQQELEEPQKRSSKEYVPHRFSKEFVPKRDCSEFVLRRNSRDVLVRQGSRDYERNSSEFPRHSREVIQKQGSKEQATEVGHVRSLIKRDSLEGDGKRVSKECIPTGIIEPLPDVSPKDITTKKTAEDVESNAVQQAQNGNNDKLADPLQPAPENSDFDAHATFIRETSFITDSSAGEPILDPLDAIHKHGLANLEERANNPESLQEQNISGPIHGANLSDPISEPPVEPQRGSKKFTHKRDSKELYNEWLPRRASIDNDDEQSQSCHSILENLDGEIGEEEEPKESIDNIYRKDAEDTDTASEKPYPPWQVEHQKALKDPRKDSINLYHKQPELQKPKKDKIKQRQEETVIVIPDTVIIREPNKIRGKGKANLNAVDGSVGHTKGEQPNTSVEETVFSPQGPSRLRDRPTNTVAVPSLDDVALEEYKKSVHSPKSELDKLAQAIDILNSTGGTGQPNTGYPSDIDDARGYQNNPEGDYPITGTVAKDIAITDDNGAHTDRIAVLRDRFAKHKQSVDRDNIGKSYDHDDSINIPIYSEKIQDKKTRSDLGSNLSQAAGQERHFERSKSREEIEPYLSREAHQEFQYPGTATEYPFPRKKSAQAPSRESGNFGRQHHSSSFKVGQ